MQLDEEALACLLEDGKTQLMFADTLAQSINARMAVAAGHGGGSTNGGSGSRSSGSGGHAGDCRAALPEEGSLDGLLLSVDELLADLPADPQLAPLLQQVVRGVDSPASPPLASPWLGSRRTAKQHDAAADAVDKLAHEEPEPGSRQQQQQQQDHMTMHLEEAAKEQQREDQQGCGGGSAGAGATASLAPSAAPQLPATTSRDKENISGSSVQQQQEPVPRVALLLQSAGKAASRGAAVGGAVAAPLAPAASVIVRAPAPTSGVSMARPASLEVPPLAAGAKPGGARVIKLSCRRELEAVLGGVAEVDFFEADALIDDDLLGDP